MLETALTAFTTFFAVIGPIDSAVLVASLTPNATKAERRAISLKAVAIATLIVLAFALFGQPLLNQLGVSLPALQVAGGIILLIIALDMTLSKRPSPARLTLKESEEAESKAEAHAEITVFPLATPLLAGPGAMTSAIVLAAGTKGDPKLLVAVVARHSCRHAGDARLSPARPGSARSDRAHGAEGDRARVRRAARGHRRAVDLQRHHREPYFQLSPGSSASPRRAGRVSR